MHPLNPPILFIALAVGAASGSIGAFIILRRMALVGDALSHVALPGIAFALVMHYDPLWGALAFLFSAAYLVWWLEGRTRLPAEAIIGILFAGSLAIGILTIPNVEIIESLFGAFPALSLLPLVLTVTLAIGATVAAFLLARRFLFRILSPELATVKGVNRNHDLLFYLLFSLVVGLGIKLVGTLLMGALTIIPAAIARNVSRSMAVYLPLSSFLGAALSAAGVALAYYLGVPPGPTIILLGIALFVVSLGLVRHPIRMST